MGYRSLASLFIVQGIIGVITSFLLGYSANPYAYHLGIPMTAVAGLQIWIGIGLYRKHPFARWLALGSGALMVLGGVLVPLMMIVMASAAEVIGAIFSRGAPPQDWLAGARWMAIVATIYALVAATIAYRGFKYLRSYEGRCEFGAQVDAEGMLNDESFGVVVGSAVAWIVASYLSMQDITIHASSLPRFLQTAEMRRFADKEYTKKVEQITNGAMFSADSRHFIFPPSDLSREVMVLDVQTGKLNRTGQQGAMRDMEFYYGMAPDASSMLHYGNWISLADGETHKIDSLVSSFNIIGFATPTTVLQYEARTEKLELIDLEHNRKVYSISVPQSQRGDPSELTQYGWSRFSNEWSPDRRTYAWFNRDRTLALLDVENGGMRTIPCPHCSYGSALDFIEGGKMLFLPDPVTHPDSAAQSSSGMLYDIADDVWTPVAYRGNPQHIGDAGTRGMFWQYQARRLDYRVLGGSSRNGWTLTLPQGFEYVIFSADGKLLTAYGPVTDSQRQPTFARFDRPRDGGEIAFVSFEPAFEGQRGPRVSPDSRYQVYVQGTRIELIDVQAALAGLPASRTMDVLEDDELSKPKVAKRRRSITAHWAAVLFPESQTAVQDDAYAANEIPLESRYATQLAAQQSDVSVAEAPAQSPAVGGILKCVDSTGKMIFTQAACPAGSKVVDAPALDSRRTRDDVPVTPVSARNTGSAANFGFHGVPDSVRAILKPGDRLLGSSSQSKSCPGNPYQVRKPDGQVQSYSIDTLINEHAIERAGGKTEVVYAAGFPTERIYASSGSALAGACEQSFAQAQKQASEGSF